MSGYTPDIPRDLVARAQQGDEAALRELVEQTYPPVRRWALVHTGDPAEADDLTQDVLVQMIRKLDAFQGEARFSTWLYTVTRNAATDRLRKRQRRARVVKDPRSYDELVPRAPSDPSRVFEQEDLAALLKTLFEELPGRQREIFDLVELQGLRAAEVAERLGIEPVSVRAHLFKARRRLRSRILEMRPELVEDFT